MIKYDFATCLTEFFTVYLPGRKGLSENTIKSYRDTFRFILIFAEETKQIPAECMSFDIFNEEFVESFLNWLETSRKNSVSTCNQRLSAIHAYIHYAKIKVPEYLSEYRKILNITLKRTHQPHMEFLTPDAVKLLLSAPDMTTPFGRRDTVLLTVLYDCGARVQELCDLCVGDIRLQKPYTIRLTGKPNGKIRDVPVMSETAKILNTYMQENNLNCIEKFDYPLFFNHKRQKLTRAGIAYILKKYYSHICETNSSLPDKISPHTLRHSKAMHMLQAGVNLIYIRDFLGHTHVTTTEIYAKADTEMKRAAIERVAPRISPTLPDWTKNKELMTMLNELCR